MSLAASLKAGEQLLTHRLSLSSVEKSQAKDVSLGARLWALRGEVMRESESFPLIFFIVSNLRWCAGTSLLDSWTSQGTLYFMIVKISVFFFRGNVVENSILPF